jgi:hypothetical protein
VSSCRETIRTLGCLQAVAIAIRGYSIRCYFRQIVAGFHINLNGNLSQSTAFDNFLFHKS